MILFRSILLMSVIKKFLEHKQRWGRGLIKLPHRLHIPLQPTFPRGKAGIESRFLSCKTDKISNIKRVGKCNLCIAVLAVEGNMELIIKGYFDAVGFGVIQCRYYFIHSHYPFFEKRYW